MLAVGFIWLVGHLNNNGDILNLKTISTYSWLMDKNIFDNANHLSHEIY